MASFYKTAAAVCLAALSGLQSEAQPVSATYKFAAVNVDEDAYLAANLARNGKLPVHISGVTKEEGLVASLTEKVQTPEGTDETCEALIKSDLSTLFHHSFDYNGTPDYRKLVQDALDKGLQVFNNTYPKNEAAWKTIWQEGAGASLAYLLASNSTEIGCIIGKCTKEPGEQDTLDDETGTATAKAALFCELKPAATANQAAFDEEYFNGLIARKTALADMTEDDLKAPVGNGAGAAIPTISIIGFVAMLTAISA